MTVTPEMLDVAHNEYVAWSGTDMPHSSVFRSIYDAMKALDPEVERMRHDIGFLLACIDQCDEAEAPPCELDALDLAILGDIRRDNPQTPDPIQYRGEM